ncbi:MAG: ferredoxin, partial [Bacteroidales bacterium]|nr:ferredoxin [Bacteroidales bacterium]
TGTFLWSKEMIRITHQRIKCIGCGNCVEVAQNNWSMNDSDGKADLHEANEKKRILYSAGLRRRLRAQFRSSKYLSGKNYRVERA